jgi:hypothetical protein
MSDRVNPGSIASFRQANKVVEISLAFDGRGVKSANTDERGRG